MRSSWLLRAFFFQNKPEANYFGHFNRIQVWDWKFVQDFIGYLIGFMNVDGIQKLQLFLFEALSSQLFDSIFQKCLDQIQMKVIYIISSIANFDPKKEPGLVFYVYKFLTV